MSYDVGSMLYSSGGRPATALRPMFGISAPWYTQTSVPSSLRTLRGANSLSLSGRWASNSVGGSTTWSSTLTRMRFSAVGIAAVALPDRRYLTSTSAYVAPGSLAVDGGGEACTTSMRRTSHWRWLESV